MGTILVVDDDPVFLKAASLVLTRAGHTVAVTASGRDALAEVVRDGVDLIVLDLRMPAMEGTTFLQVLRSYLRWGKIPVIVVTATTNDGQLDRAKEMGIQGWFDKTTLQLPDLVAAVASQLANPSPPE